MFHNSPVPHPLPSQMQRRRKEATLPTPFGGKWVPQGRWASQDFAAKRMQSSTRRPLPHPLPETILDVPFGHKDTGLVLRFGKGVDDAHEGVT